MGNPSGLKRLLARSRWALAQMLVMALVLSLIAPAAFASGASVTLSTSSAAFGYSLPVSVTATGNGTDFVNGGTNVFLLDGTNTPVNVITGVSVASGTSLSFSVATGLSQGNYTIRISYPTGEATTPFTVTAPATVSLSQSSLAVGYGSAMTVTASGVNTHFASGQTVVTLLDSNSSSTGKVSSVSVSTTTRLSFSIATGLAQGSYTLKIVTGGETVTTPFSVTAAASVSLSQSATSADYSSAVSVTATGTNTHFTSGQTVVSLVNGSGATAGTVSGTSVASATSVSFNIATGLAQGDYTVRIVTGGETVTAAFSVSAAASATLSQPEVSQGYGSAVSQTVSGENTHFVSGQTTVTLLNGSGASTGNISGVSVSLNTAMSFNIGIGLTEGSYTVRIVTGSETVSVPFAVSAPASGTLSQSEVAQGYSSALSLAVSGQNTHFASGQTAVSLVDDSQASVGSLSGLSIPNTTSLSFTLATGLTEGDYSLQIVTGSETVSIPFTVTPAPTAALSQTAVALGYTSAVSLTIQGTNTHFASGTTSLSVLDGSGNTAGSVSGTNVASATSVSFSLGTGLTQGTYTARATTGSETVDATLTITAPATLAASPSGAAAGYSSQSVTVTGTNTHFVSGQTTVALLDGNGDSTGNATSVSVTNSTTLTFTLTSGLAEGDYTLRATTGSERADGSFAVTAAPTMTLSPSAIVEGYASAVTVTATGVGTSFTVNPTVAITDSNGQAVQMSSSVQAASNTSGTFTVPTGLEAGTYHVSITANSVTTTTDLTVAPDGEPPTITITAPSGSTWYKAGDAISVTASVTDNSAGMAGGTAVTATLGGQEVTGLSYTSTTDATGTIGGSVTVPAGLTTGANNLVIGLSDRSANAGSATVSVNVDATAPVVTISAPTDGSSYKKGDSIAVAATVTDTGSGFASNAAVTATLNGTTVTGLTFTRLTSTTGTISGSIAVPNGLGGAINLVIGLSDRSGLPGTKTVSLNIDSALPTWTGGSLTAESLNANGSLTLRWSGAIDNMGVVGYKAYQDGVAITPAPVAGPTYGVTGLTANVLYTFKVEAVDAAGNYSTTGPTLSKMIDTQGPTLTFSAPAGGSWYKPGDSFSVSIGVSDNYSGVASGSTITATLGGKTVSGLSYVATTTTAGTISGNVTVPSDLATGAANLVVQVSDQQGNAGSATRSLSIDASAPALTFSTPAAGTTFKRGDSIPVTVTVTDAGHGLSASVTPVATLGGASSALTLAVGGDGLSGTISGNVAVPDGLTGAQSLTVSLADALGNNREAGVTLNIDSVLPTWDAGAQLTSSAVMQTSLTLSWMAASDTTGVTGYRIYKNGALLRTVTGATTADIAGLNAGTAYSFRIEAGDAAGNYTNNEGPQASVTTLADGAQTLILDVTADTNWHQAGQTVTVSADVTGNAAAIESATVSLSATVGALDADSTLSYTAATSTTGTVAGTVTIPAGLTSGAQDLVITMSDGNGNLGSGTASVKVDNDPPALTFQTPASGASYKRGDSISVSLTVNDAGSGITAGQAVSATLDGAAVTGLTYANGQITGSIAVPNGLTGNKTLAVAIPDISGRTGTASRTVSIDSVLPTWQNGALTHGDPTTDSVTLTWSGATDTTGVVRYHLLRNGAVVANVDGSPYSATGLAAGTSYTFKVEAGDLAGNYSTNGPSVTITTQAPAGGGGGGGVVITPPADNTGDTGSETGSTDGQTGETGGETGNTGGAPVPTETEVQPDGTVAVTAQVNETQVKAGSDLEIDLSAPTAPAGNQAAEVSTRTAEIPVAAIEKLQDQGQQILLDAGVASLRIPPAAFTGLDAVQSGGAKADLRISVRAIDPEKSQSASGNDGAILATMTKAKETGLKPAGKVLFFQAAVVGANGSSTAVTKFSQRLTVRIPFGAGANPDLLGVYRLNRTTGEWEYRGGKVDPVARVVEVELDGFSEYTVMEYTKSFTDIQSHWAKNEIIRMAARHVAQGMTETTFAPDGNVTRAQFATLLVRALGVKAGNGFITFTDVAADDWFNTSVSAAADAGLIRGAEGQFRPGDLITRQEMAVILSRALGLRGIKAEAGPAAQLSGYADRDQIAVWAWDAAAQLAKLGMITGRTPTTYNPQATATRAEALVVIQRLLRQVGDL